MLNHLRNNKTFVIANDAGGAENLFRITKKNKNLYTYYLSGPAKKIFPKVKNTCLSKIKENIKNSDVLLCSTSFDNQIYYDAIQIAKKNRKYCAVLFDHWVNYSQRLRKKRNDLLPDEIIVVDIEAYKKVKKLYPKIKISLINNMYLNEYLDKVNKFMKNLRLSRTTALYCTNKIKKLESRYQNNKIKFNYDEFDAINFFLENYKKIDPKIKKIILRIHPSENSSKYNTIISKYKKVIPIMKDNKSDLSKQIALCKFVIGCETFPLVIACKSKKKVFYSIPPKGNKSLLPFKKIKYLRDII